MPSPAARRDILSKQLVGMAHSLTPEQVGGLAREGEGAQLLAWSQRSVPPRIRISHSPTGAAAPPRPGSPPPSQAQVAELADSAHGFVAADLAALCNEAAMIALRRIVAGGGGSGDGSSSGPCVTLDDFKASETRTRPSAMRELAFEIPKASWRGRGGCAAVLG